MHVIIFQLADEKHEEAKRRLFLSIEDLEREGKQPELFYYDSVYVGEYRGESLEDLYVRFNTDIPEDYHGHSLSVSDVITIIDREHLTEKAYYVDSIGFKELPDFMKQMIKVNFPIDKSSYLSGNGEGCWMTVTIETKAAHDRDERKGKYLGVLANDCVAWDLPAGTVVPFEMRGEYRPVALYDWLVTHEGGKS